MKWKDKARKVLGVSTVIGVILMVAVSVALAAAVYVYVSSTLPGEEEVVPPITFLQIGGNDYLTITGVGGPVVKDKFNITFTDSQGKVVTYGYVEDVDGDGYVEGGDLIKPNNPSALSPGETYTVTVVYADTMVGQTIFSYGASSAGTDTSGWLSGWMYRIPITITEQSGSTLTDYQVLIQLSSTNFNFAHAKSDGSDIRFTSSDGKTSLDYWIEEWTATSAKIWVEIPSIPANGQIEIYMYYGNPSATSESDGNAVFDFFDDFEGSVLDTTKWVVEEQNPTIQNSICTITGGNSIEAIRTKSSFNAPFIVHFYMKPDSKSAGDWDSGIAIGQTKTNLLGFIDDAWGNYMEIMRLWWSSTDDISTSRSDYSTFHEYQVTMTSAGNTFKDLTDGRTNNDDYSRSYDGYLWLVNDNENGNNKGYYDWVFVRKYASPEPAVTIGSEEQQ